MVITLGGAASLNEFYTFISRTSPYLTSLEVNYIPAYFNNHQIIFPPQSVTFPKLVDLSLTCPWDHCAGDVKMHMKGTGQEDCRTGYHRNARHQYPCYPNEINPGHSTSILQNLTLSINPVSWLTQSDQELGHRSCLINMLFGLRGSPSTVFDECCCQLCMPAAELLTIRHTLGAHFDCHGHARLSKHERLLSSNRHRSSLWKGSFAHASDTHPRPPCAPIVQEVVRQFRSRWNLLCVYNHLGTCSRTHMLHGARHKPLSRGSHL